MLAKLSYNRVDVSATVSAIREELNSSSLTQERIEACLERGPPVSRKALVDRRPQITDTSEAVQQIEAKQLGKYGVESLAEV